MQRERAQDSITTLPGEGPTHRGTDSLDGLQTGVQYVETRGRTVKRPFNLVENKTDLLQEVMAGVLGWLSVASSLPIYAQLFIGEKDYDVGATGEAFMLVAGLSTVVMGMVTNLPIIVAPSVLYTSRGSFSIGGILAAQFVSNFVAALVMGSAIRLSVVSHIPTALRVGVGCGISVLVSVLGGRSVGLLTGDGFAPPEFTWQLALGLLIVTGSCISWSSRSKWPLIVGLPIAITLIVYAIFDRSKFEGYSSSSPLSKWSEGTAGTISFREISGYGSYWFYILRISFSIVINVTSILLILMDALCLQDMRKDSKGMTKIDTHKFIGTSKKFRIMGVLVPLMSMGGNALGVTTQAAFVETLVSIFGGARTGLASVVTGVLLLLNMLLWPLNVLLAPDHVTGALAIFVTIRFFASVKDVDISYLPHGLAVVMPLLIIPFTFEFVDGLCIALLMAFICEQSLRILSAEKQLASDCDNLFRCNRLSTKTKRDLSVSGASISYPDHRLGFGTTPSHSQSNRNTSLLPITSRASHVINCTAGASSDLEQGLSNCNISRVSSAVVPNVNGIRTSLHPGFALVALVELLLRVVDEQT